MATYSSGLAKAQQQLAQAASTSGSGGSGTSGGSATGGKSPATGTSGGSSGAAGAAGSTSGSGSSSAKTGSASGSSGASRTGSATGSGSAGGASGTGGSALSAQASQDAQDAKILNDQASITAAEQAVNQAQTNLNGATLTAPIGGVVGAVGITAGQTESSSNTITIVGTGAATVTLPVPVTKLPSVKVGQAAVATPPGLGSIKGTVTQIGLLPSSAANASTVTYSVTVTLPDTPQTLATGTYAMTTITTASVTDALTIPASAVPGATSGATRIQVMNNGAVSEVPITVGAVGGGLVEVRDGLKSGEQVVIADVNSALPTNSTNNVRGLTGGAGGPGGAGGTFRVGTGGAGAAPGRG